jgi:hypothetical protein
MTPTRTMRLEALIGLLNRIHCRRRLLGRRTDHLHARCKRITAAYLASREDI